MRYCRVQGCRHADTHVTCAHRCGTCGRFGHGRMECGRPRARATLDGSPDTLPVDLWCSVQGCNFPWTHTMEAHFGALELSPLLHPPPQPQPLQPSQPSPPTSPTTTITRLTLPPAYHTPPRTTPRAPPRLVQNTWRTCPHCKSYGHVDVHSVVYTGADCSICFESRPCVVFEACRHANVCAECAVRLS